MAVIYIRIDPADKKLLEAEARKLAMSVSTYCRMILLKSIRK